MARNRLESWIKDARAQHALKILFALLVTLLLTQFRLDTLESTAYDLRVRFSPKPKASGEVVLIKIDEDTERALLREPEVRDWTTLAQQLAIANPKHVVSLINPLDLRGPFSDMKTLSAALEALPFMYGANSLMNPGQTHLPALMSPFEKVPVEPMPKTADSTVLARDGVSRRLILNYEGQPTVQVQLANEINGITDIKDYQGHFTFLKSTQTFTRYRKPGAFATYNFKDVMNGTFDKQVFTNKIVLIGRDNRQVLDDYSTTPLSKQILALSNLEVQANVLDTLILNQAPRIAPDWIRQVLTFMICILTMYIVLSVRPGRGLVMLGSLVFSYSLVTLILFAAFGWVLPVVHPLVAVFICYYFVIPYRLIIENRKSWEYYQKNKLLTQVEELKSNFLRMMSHDLKTPLARIQGMAEVIRQEQPNLSEAQSKALMSISESSEELTDFIGSILSLSRIESKEVKLHLRSKDLNQLVQQVEKKLDYMAKRKNIEIVTELEPMFSAKMDEDLIRQVISNLIENAIKYSPENSKVLISTEEQNGELVLQVADQGRGISEEEQSQIFTRFFRGRNSRSDTVGNGLGLYLANYFVNLHHGVIEVESELNKGSTFTVRLQPFPGGPHA